MTAGEIAYLRVWRIVNDGGLAPHALPSIEEGYLPVEVLSVARGDRYRVEVLGSGEIRTVRASELDANESAEGAA